MTDHTKCRILIVQEGVEPFCGQLAIAPATLTSMLSASTLPGGHGEGEPPTSGRVYQTGGGFAGRLRSNVVSPSRLS